MKPPTNTELESAMSELKAECELAHKGKVDAAHEVAACSHCQFLLTLVGKQQEQVDAVDRLLESGVSPDELTDEQRNKIVADSGGSPVFSEVCRQAVTSFTADMPDLVSAVVHATVSPSAIQATVATLIRIGMMIGQRRGETETADLLKSIQ